MALALVLAGGWRFSGSVCPGGRSRCRETNLVLTGVAQRRTLALFGDLEDDNDSSADVDSLRDSTASITSSILEYRNINGRKYQSSNTTEYCHQFTLMLMEDELFQAPLSDSPQKILDVGTGTGIWAIDIADEYPSAEVLGFDISAVQPSWVPPNCSFQIDDAQLDWTFKPNEYDLIHMRYLYGGIDNWDKLYLQAFTHVRPGGWVENTEIDLETRSENPKVADDPSHIFKKWCNLFWEAGDKIGRTFKIAREGQMEQKMREAGFVDVQHRQWKVPIGGWPQDPKALPYYNVHTVIGRKPETAPAATN
ncbi:hypothetical protein QQX98_010442 [Neonectria punicea]|uniref:S-adenosyl-L-methionine-dependent methyltransferase n=1 Tax=Neonectria punicea TaxID=979145 RepID=A0ABR1GPT9_9HYPO